jgi:hypothetical protein
MNCGYRANGSLIRNDAGWSLLKSPNFWHCNEISRANFMSGCAASCLSDKQRENSSSTRIIN